MRTRGCGEPPVFIQANQLSDWAGDGKGEVLQRVRPLLEGLKYFSRYSNLRIILQISVFFFLSFMTHARLIAWWCSVIIQLWDCLVCLLKKKNHKCVLNLENPVSYKVHKTNPLCKWGLPITWWMYCQIEKEKTLVWQKLWRFIWFELNSDNNHTWLSGVWKKSLKFSWDFS